VRALLALTGWFERVNDAVGRAAAWLTLLMVLLGAFNAIARYLGRFTGVSLSSNVFIEAQWYLFSAVFLLAAASTAQQDGHVRVDVVYGRLGPRARDTIDLLGTLLLMLPFCVFALVMSWPAVENSFHVLEQSPDPGGLPRYPIKALIPLCFALLIVQGLSQLVRLSARLLGRERA
jgi:TRAP-type mannitol/chloroaromatic compound transport system permease small subunit